MKKGTATVVGGFRDLVWVNTWLMNAVDVRLMDDCALTVGRYDVLRVLGARPGTRVNDIAEELTITWGGVSKLIDRLEAADLCRRRPNPADGRSSLIELTPAGVRLLTRAEQVVEDELRCCLDGAVPIAQFDHLAAAVGVVRTSVQAARRERATA